MGLCRSFDTCHYSRAILSKSCDGGLGPGTHEPSVRATSKATPRRSLSFSLLTHLAVFFSLQTPHPHSYVASLFFSLHSHLILRSLSSFSSSINSLLFFSSFCSDANPSTVAASRRSWSLNEDAGDLQCLRGSPQRKRCSVNFYVTTREEETPSLKNPVVLGSQILCL